MTQRRVSPVRRPQTTAQRQLHTQFGSPDGLREGTKSSLCPKDSTYAFRSSVWVADHAHGILHKALADAQRKGTVLRNVAALADVPS